VVPLDEIVPESEIPDVPSGRSAPKVVPNEVKMAAQIIESLTREFDPKRYEDTYRVEVLDYLKQKAAGKEIVIEEEPEEQAKVVDLMAALEASLEAAKKAPAKKSSSTSRRTSSGSKRKSA
jgi:DNA end-binding protein Ku